MKRGLSVILLLVLFAVPPAGAAPVAAPDAPLATTVFINEIHYDNASTDTGEAIEVAAPSGTDLTGWTIVLYNGSGGASYDTDALGTVAGTCGSYNLYVVNYATNGIQNGSPDGMALVNASSSVIQFLSYEGTLTATNGPANGLTSTDIGVSEAGSAAAGNSLQLAGTGTVDSDFAWQTEAASTFGACNTGQTIGGGGGDTAPTVTGTSPAGGAYGVPVDAGVISVTFSENVTFSGTVDIVCTSGTQTVTPSGGPMNWSLSHAGFAAGDVCTITIPAGQIADADTNDPPNNMAADYTWSFVIQGTSKIHAVQGSGSTAVLSTFTVEAIVVGDFQRVTGDYKLEGFFIQEENADIDANTATSEGILVYCATCPTNVDVGDKVQVTGTSSEYFNNSQLNATTADAVVVVSHNNTLPSPAAVTLPVPGVTATTLAGAQAQINAYYEPFEGMLVTIGEQLSITEYFELYRYGQVVLAQGGRFRQFTDANAPSATGYTAHQIDLAKRTVILDDDSNQQNHALNQDPDIPVFHPVPGFSTTNYFRGGDTISNLTGVLHWSFAGLSGTDAWRIRPVTSAFSYAFTSANARTTAPVSVGGSLKVGSFNTLNFFTTLDTGGTPCGPAGVQECRGANSAAELTRQRDKLVAAICALDADVLGLMELENPYTGNDPDTGDGISDYVLKDLVGALNATGSPCTDKTYAFTDGTAAGTDAIRVGIIYKTSTVTTVGTPVALTASGFTDPNSTGTQRSRPALAQTFEEKTSSERFTIVANHLKSKGCSTSPTLDTDQNDGQGCWNDTRQKGATYLVNTWLPTDPTGSVDPDFIVVGDLNSYRLEAPITNITGAGYTDLIHSLAGSSPYGYVFDGQLGYLDHALSSATLTPQVTGATEWHINADEVNLLDYNDTVLDTGETDYFEAKPTATSLYNADAYRSTDHDPVLVGLNLATTDDLSDLTGYPVAWHSSNGLKLGATWAAGHSTVGSGTNDGVVRTPGIAWSPASGGSVDVTVNGATGYVTGWIDWNNDSDFGDTGEQILTNEAFTAGQSRTIHFTIPATAPIAGGSGSAFDARFRVYPTVQTVLALAAAAPDAVDAAPLPSDGATGGEVEDYTWSFGPNAVTLRGFGATGGAAPAWPAAAGLGLLAATVVIWRRRR